MSNPALDVVTPNPFKIYPRVVTRSPVLKARVDTFANELLTVLYALKDRRELIDKNYNITPDERMRATEDLKKEFQLVLSPAVIRAEALLTIMRKEFEAKVAAAVKYIGDSSPQIEMMRQVETRASLERLSKNELKGLIFAADTSELWFYSILCAPYPMQPANDLELAAVERIKRTDPEIIDFRDGVVDAAINILMNLSQAYAYLGSNVPKMIELNLPSVVSIMVKLAYPGDAIKRQETGVR